MGAVMTTLRALTRLMENYNYSVAPGSRCIAWQLFVDECQCDLRRSPWGGAAELVVPEGFAQYWTLVAAGESRDFEAETGDCLLSKPWPCAAAE